MLLMWIMNKVNGGYVLMLPSIVLTLFYCIIGYCLPSVPLAISGILRRETCKNLAFILDRISCKAMNGSKAQA